MSQAMPPFAFFFFFFHRIFPIWGPDNECEYVHPAEAAEATEAAEAAKAASYCLTRELSGCQRLLGRDIEIILHESLVPPSIPRDVCTFDTLLAKIVVICDEPFAFSSHPPSLRLHMPQ
jgi:hypothetical protein